uniref:non-specific serine/threonine protein kinase n=1 Tax=Takifugu rubripes TaxID=31033 RepID=A0A674P9K6_TAKRU
MGEHTWGGFLPPLSLSPGLEEAETWSTELHTKASPTDAFVCRAKVGGSDSYTPYIRVAADTKAEMLLQLMLKEWQMERPKLLLSIQGGSENFTLPPKVMQAFSRGLMAAALSTGAWILTEGISTGVSKYVGEAVRTFGSHSLRSRNTVGITPWGVIHSNTDLIGRDVFKPYQPLANPLSKRACLNGFHSHFLLVDDGTVGKHGCQQGLRKSLEKHIQQQKIHPRLKLGVPVVCVVVEGGPNIVSAVLDCVQSVPPVPVFVFEGSGKAADLLAFLHKHTATDRLAPLSVVFAFGVESSEASELCGLLQQCMDHRQSITVYDSESEDLGLPDAAILTSALKGTTAGPAEQLSMTLAWNRADLAQKHILVSGQHWKVGSLEQALLDALVMDRVGFVKLLIDNGMTMSRFLTVNRLEELYNTSGGQTDRFLRHLVEDVKQTSLPEGYRLSIIDVGLVMEYLMGGAYCSTYTRKPFRAVYSRLQKKGRRESWTAVSKQRHGLVLDSSRSHLHFFRTAQPYKPQVGNTTSTGPCEAPPLVAFNFNDLFVWAVLQQRQQMALFLWPRGEEALARATAACQLYRSMAFEARRSSMDDSTAERLRTCSLEFGQLAVDLLDVAFHQNEQMAMKLLTSEMEAWSHFTCLQMAVSSCHRPFVSHSCTQTLLTDLWSGPLNMRKNSSLKIILSLILPPAILLLEFKSKAEMCHVPQSYETMLFGLDPAKSESSPEQKSSRCVCPFTAALFLFQMFYLGFLMLFSYVVLVKMEEQPSAQEWLLISYMVSTALEKTREVLMSEPRKLSHKLKVWFSEYWNVSDFLAILLFLAGLALRWHPEPYRTAGRISYCLDLIFWFIRSMDLLAVNQHAGPYLTIITKMTRNMFFIVVMMAIVLLSFGVSRKAILSPNSEPSWSLARDVVFQPYWMIYGEVYASEMDVCDGVQHCPPAAFLSPLLQAVYMFLQYIIMVNILIAFVNNIYFDMAATSNKLWKYNRYRYIMTYQDRPWLPPPMVLLSHVVLLLRTICRRCRGALFLGCEDRKLLHEFEEKCVEAYFQEKSNDASSNQMNRIRTTAERVEEMNVMVEEVSEKVNFIQDSLLELDSQLGHLQDLSALAVDTLTMLSASDSQLQEEVRLSQCQPPAVPWHDALVLSCPHLVVVLEIQPLFQRIMQHVVTPEFPANGDKRGRYPSGGGCYEDTPTATAGLCHPAWRTSLSPAHRVQRGLSEMKHLSSAAGHLSLTPFCCSCGAKQPDETGHQHPLHSRLHPRYSLQSLFRNLGFMMALSRFAFPYFHKGGEEVSIYSLEELPSDGDVGSTSISSWASRGLSAILQPLSSAEGSLDGGLRQGCRVLCTWAEQDVLRPGLVYVVKAFRPEVLGVWQQYFHGSTSLQLCLREIQQQRAAQKLMQVFNRIRPRDLCPSPSFLDVSLLLCPSSGHWFTIERNMCGEFRKYNNNSGEEIAPCCSLEELLLAFSHWTFEYSHRELLVLDIQGVGEALTDPTVIMAQEKRGEMLFGPDNLGDVAIKGFLQRHCCRTSCSRLGLTGQLRCQLRCRLTPLPKTKVRTILRSEDTLAEGTV